MTPYYADDRKYFLRTKNPVIKSKEDKAAGQMVSILGSVVGITIRPDRQWTPFCDALFRKHNASRVCLEEISAAPNGSLAFINHLPGCRSLAIERGRKVDLSPLTGNPSLEDLQLYPLATYQTFDLASLPALRRCQIPLCRQLSSLFRCKRLISLCISGGRHEGVLDLQPLEAIEELICINVKRLKGVRLNDRSRLRSLELSQMPDFESVQPQQAATKELRVVEFNRVPQMKIDWLKDAEKAECITLRQGEIPSIKVLTKLKHLHVLDLFGTKVKDGELTFRDSLKGELDHKLWADH
jgi:hypothetical protein